MEITLHHSRVGSTGDGTNIPDSHDDVPHLLGRGEMGGSLPSMCSGPFLEIRELGIKTVNF